MSHSRWWKFRWSRSLIGGHQPAWPRRRFAPRCEQLEDRFAPAVTLSISNAAPVPEGDSGSTGMVFVVTGSGDLAPEVLVDYATQAGTALPGVDYQPSRGTLDFVSNQTSATITVPVLGNKLVQPNRTFTVNLSNPRFAAPSFAPQQVFAVGRNPQS